MKPLATNLRRFREARIINGKKMSQVQLGEAAGLPQTTISKYERGESLPDVRSLLKLAAGLRVSLEALVEGLDVRFDLVYQELRASITMPDIPTDGLGMKPAIQLGAVSPSGLDDGEEVDPTHPAERLSRVGEEIISVAQELRTWRPPAVARGGGPGLPERTRNSHASPRRKVAEKPRTAPKR
jgi:transcriptional regulator with XRE-family HTH domain